MNLGIVGKNFLITGGKGMLATDISKHLRSLGYNVIDDFFDITVPVLWEQILKTNKIDFIVHAAAITDVDYCELNANECYRVNYEFIKKVIPLLKEEKFIYFSSTGVYGNSKNTFFNNEDDLTLPSTKYHLSKLKTENYLKFNYDNHLILRLGWLYGGNVNHKKNFVHKILREAIQKEVIYSDDDILGSPTSTFDVSKSVVSICLIIPPQREDGLFKVLPLFVVPEPTPVLSSKLYCPFLPILGLTPLTPSLKIVPNTLGAIPKAKFSSSCKVLK